LTDEEMAESTNARERTGGGTRNIFPNLFMGGNDIELRIPKGPQLTEIWMWGFLPRNATKEERRRRLTLHQHVFGPAGLHEQDDGENWDQSTKAMLGVVSQRYPLHYAMGIGHGEVIDDEASPPRIESFVNEHGQLWHYMTWAGMMTASSWDEFKAKYSQPPGHF
ncbi:MAG: hypothetical protein AB7G38_19245, partial [Dehalococcoidia bacterium]